MIATMIIFFLLLFSLIKYLKRHVIFSAFRLKTLLFAQVKIILRITSKTICTYRNNREHFLYEILANGAIIEWEIRHEVRFVLFAVTGSPGRAWIPSVVCWCCCWIYFIILLVFQSYHWVIKSWNFRECSIYFNSPIMIDFTDEFWVDW